jgi:hypothetical protein
MRELRIHVVFIFDTQSNEITKKIQSEKNQSIQILM